MRTNEYLLIKTDVLSFRKYLKGAVGYAIYYFVAFSQNQLAPPVIKQYKGWITLGLSEAYQFNPKKQFYVGSTLVLHFCFVRFTRTVYVTSNYICETHSSTNNVKSLYNMYVAFIFSRFQYVIWMVEPCRGCVDFRSSKCYFPHISTFM